MLIELKGSVKTLTKFQADSSVVQKEDEAMRL